MKIIDFVLKETAYFWGFLASFRIYRYVVSGTVAAIVNFGTLYFVADFLGYWYLFGASVAFSAALIVSFLLQKFWTFEHYDAGFRTVSIQGSLYLLIALCGLGFNTAFVYLAVERFNLHYFVAQFISALIVAIGNFIFYRSVVFARRKNLSAIHPTA